MKFSVRIQIARKNCSARKSYPATSDQLLVSCPYHALVHIVPVIACPLTNLLNLMSVSLKWLYLLSINVGLG